ncbi:hypothetical protein PC39_00080 [Salinisphaera sp. PC39]|uniref:carotenoid biosynthesis protein n=1 Tax=Salinisphaera sp. PC39 TaxID=1304156 RepID=UPI0033403831
MSETLTHRAPPGARPLCLGLIGIWFLALLAGLFYPSIGSEAYYVQLLSLSLFGLVHGSERYGLPAMLAFLAIMFVVVNLTENLSIATGVPFGNFEHTPAMGPKLFQVPVIVGFAYFSAGYLGWALANLLLGEPDRDRGALALFATPVVAMFITTAWDACIDPIGGTVARNWIWKDGGGYFGVPLSNFIGWMITTYIAFQLFALLPARRPAIVRTGQDRLWWALPAIQLGVMGLQYPLNLMLLPDAEITDPSGTTWQTGDIFEGTTVVSLFTLIFIAVTGLFAAARREP